MIILFIEFLLFWKIPMFVFFCDADNAGEFIVVSITVLAFVATDVCAFVVASAAITATVVLQTVVVANFFWYCYYCCFGDASFLSSFILVLERNL